MLNVKKVSSKLHNRNEVALLLKTVFPGKEQFPLWLLLFLARREMVEFNAYYDGEVFVGTTYTASYDDMAYVLYLAVCPDMQSKGYGSEILTYLKQNHRGKGIALNIESLYPKAVNLEQRKARLSFYERNGLVDTGFRFKNLGEDYTILSNAEEFSVDVFRDTIRKLSYGVYRLKISKHQEDI